MLRPLLIAHVPALTPDLDVKRVPFLFPQGQWAIVALLV